MKKDTLKARAQSAKSARAINDMVSDTVSRDTTCAAVEVFYWRCILLFPRQFPRAVGATSRGVLAVCFASFVGCVFPCVVG